MLSSQYCKKDKLVFPFKSVAQEFKAGKVGLAVMLHESIDPTDPKTIPGLRTGRQWKGNSAVNSAQESLKLK